MRRKILTAAAAAFVVMMLVAGCAAIGSSYDVTIVNNSSSHIDDINISDSDQSTWGDDQMPPDTDLDPGDEITLEGVGPIKTPDSVDVRATDRIWGTEIKGFGLDCTKTIYITDSGVTN